MQEQVLGDYRILKEIGQGALGKVVLAEHRFIKKRFALKILPQELCRDPEFVRAFEEEVVKLAALDHPHIVKIHTVSFAEGVYFLVTDCIVDSIGETTNLADYMSGRKEKLREDELISLMGQIAEALDYAHQKNVSHKMLKLNNILIGKGNPGIEVAIGDFGLAKIISPGKVVLKVFEALSEGIGALPVDEAEKVHYSPFPLEADKLSQLSRSFLQSYSFLAPEQKLSEQAGSSADVYSFGVLAYYLISGYFPEGIFEMPSRLAPEYRYDWDYLITQCLQSNPSQRPKQLGPLLVKKTTREPLAIQPTKPRFVEEKESFPTIEQLKEKLKQTIPVAPPPAVKEPVLVAVAEPVAAIEREETYPSQPISLLFNRDVVVTKYQPEKKEAEAFIPIETEVAVIRGGEFLRGSNEGNRDEIPAHRVLIDSFAIDIHPVTNEQFVRLLEYMGGEKDQHYNDLIRLKDSRINRSGGRLSIESGYSKHPVVGVTWYGAVAYADWVGKRLPTEAEWEIAARGGLENSTFPTGALIEKSQANFFSSDTTPVMSYVPNGYGLFDMAGNVYEWCQDWYGYNYYETSQQEPRRPKGPVQGVYRVLRGGCWKSLKEDLRSSQRHRNNPGTVNSTYGFRCAVDIRQ